MHILPYPLDETGHISSWGMNFITQMKGTGRGQITSFFVGRGRSHTMDALLCHCPLFCQRGFRRMMAGNPSPPVGLCSLIWVKSLTHLVVMPRRWLACFLKARVSQFVLNVSNTSKGSVMVLCIIFYIVLMQHGAL